MKKILIIAMCLVFTTPALANESGKIDKACYADAFKTKPVSITDQRFALNDYARCMESAIKTELKKKMPEKKLADMNVYMENIATNYQKFYWDLYNDESCKDEKGSEKHLYHLKNYRKLLQEMLENVIKAK